MTTSAPFVPFDALRLTGSSVVAIGTFDGVHLGHRAMLADLRQRADRRGARVVVVAFDRPPRAVLRPEPELRLLTTLPERAALLADAGADVVAGLPFDRALASRTADDFTGELCERTGMVELVGGPDMALGRGREGTPGRLAEIGQTQGFAVALLEQRTVDSRPVRSDAIRAALLEGDVAGAEGMLGRRYGLSGVVVQGDQRGRTIGVPTANLAWDPERLVPANGVYAVHAVVDGRVHPAATNVGVRPTVDGTRRTVETHLLDFEGDLYERALEVRFVDRLRDEQKFGSLDDLVAQIRQDMTSARERLARS